MKQNVSWHSIPKLYQDAITITRELQIEYIWIDSLCIIQDDLGDWERESIRMRTVYGNSYLNIAGCHARESSGGLFSTSNLMNCFPTYSVPGSTSKYIRQQPHYTHLDYGSNYTEQINQQVLLSRGWVLQERLLSPRIAYYDAEELKWECNLTTDCQCGGMSVMKNSKVDYVEASPSSIIGAHMAKRVITGGFLKVDGKWVRLLASVYDLGSETKPPSYRLVHAETGAEFSALFKTDYIMSAEQVTVVQDVFILFWGVFEGGLSTFIILKQLSGDEERFERLGIWWHDKEAYHGTIQLLNILQDRKVIIIV
ncbi:heterokaryon incompatibility protein-domain-containing protein [Nemania diffusa]|nr:heterokaryon incompatibility protein-domain-containing protein [Nemania diffusa]